MSTGYGKIVSDGAGNNAIAHSVNRATSSIANIPVHRCEFRTTVTMPSFSVPDDIASWGGWMFQGLGIPQFGDYVFSDDGEVEETRLGFDEVTDAKGFTYRAYYGLSLETIGGVHTWVLQRCVVENSSAPWPYIHTAWTAQWRSAFASAAWRATHGVLTFSPMSEAAYKTRWRGAACRDELWFQDYPEEPPSGNRENYHCWLDAAGALTCAVDIIGGLP